jgi:hypothetical protein
MTPKEYVNAILDAKLYSSEVCYKLAVALDKSLDALNSIVEPLPEHMDEEEMGSVIRYNNQEAKDALVFCRQILGCDTK